MIKSIFSPEDIFFTENKIFKARTSIYYCSECYFTKRSKPCENWRKTFSISCGDDDIKKWIIFDDVTKEL